MEGRRAVEELLVAGRRRVRDVWLVGGATGLSGIAEAAARRRVPVRTVSRERLDAEARTEVPQGVLAHAHPLPEVDLDDLLAGGGAEPPFLLALDGVTDPRNLGALLRSAQGAGLGGVLLGRHRSAHLTPAATKAAAGAIEHVPMSIVSGIPAALARARQQGLWVLGLAAGTERSLYELGTGRLDLAREGLVLVVGSEGRGLSELAAKRCDVVLSIPMAGSLASLNVAAAGAVAMFEVARLRQAYPT